MKNNRHKVFILETADPFEFLKDVNEGVAIEQICKNLGHWSKRIQIFNKDDFRKAIDYISSIDPEKGNNEPIVIHLSMHGNESGIAIGPDFIEWKELSSMVIKSYSNLLHYLGKIIYIISSCGANNQELTKCLQSELCTTKKGFIPPEYVFTYDSESINWKDSMIGWTVLYRMALEIDYDNKSTVMNALNKIAKIDIGKIKYHRWDGKSKSYKHFTGK